MDRELVLKFKYDNNIYIVYKEKNNYIGGKLYKNKIITKLNKEEKKLLNEVLNNVVSNRKEKYATIQYLGTLIDLYKDKNNGIYTFKNHDGSNVTKTDLYNLNKIFNNQSLEVNMNYLNNNPYYKRIVKYGKKAIVVLVSATMMLESGCALRNTAEKSDDLEETFVDTIVLPKLSENTSLSNISEITIESLEDKEIETIEEIISNEISPEDIPSIEDTTFIEDNNLSEYLEDPVIIPEYEEKYEYSSSEEKINNLKNIIKENINLTESEKNFILENFNIIIDNIDLIDYEQVAYTYKNLYIEYHEGLLSEGSAGRLSNSLCRIQISNSTCLEDADKVILLHELGHILENPNRNWEYNYLFEGLNSMFNSEYFGEKYGRGKYNEFDASYDTANKYIYALCEILGPDVMRKFHFNQDTDWLIKEMMKYLPTKEECEIILSYIQILSYNKIRDEYTNSVEDSLFSFFAGMYFNKYNEPIYYNLEIMSRFNPELVASNIEYSDEYEEFDRGLQVVNQKAYFNQANSMYMVPSTYTLKRTINNYKNIYSIEEGLKMGSIRLENGEYVTANSSIVIGGDQVIETIPFYEMKIPIDLSENFLKENIKVK